MEKETAAPAPPQDAREELRAVQIRDRLHAMDRSARPLAISASMKAGDDSVVAAVLSAPDFVSGLEAAEHSFVAAAITLSIVQVSSVRGAPCAPSVLWL